MNNVVPIDRVWVNIAIKLQLLRLNEDFDWNEIYHDATILQEIACGNIDGIPHFCQTCGERTTDYSTRVVDYIDVGIGPFGPICEESYHCQLCHSQIAYWAYGRMEPRINES